MPDVTATPDAAPRRSFWKRRLGDPVIALLTQGVTPDKLAATFAVGTTVSLFPFLGTTTALNLGVDRDRRRRRHAPRTSSSCTQWLYRCASSWL